MDPSRYEMNRQVKTILIQHSADLCIIDYSYIGGTVYLSGTIQKNTCAEFTPAEIEDLANDISRLNGVRDIQFDLDNWVLIRGRRAWQIMKKKSRSAPLSPFSPGQAGAVSTDVTLEIKRQEKLAEVIKDIKRIEESETDKSSEDFKKRIR